MINICRVIMRVAKRIAIYFIDTYYINKYDRLKNIIKIQSIKSIEDTIETIFETGKSVSRFGDGEFKWITHSHRRGESFQENSTELSIRLRHVLESNEQNHIVCISPAFHDLDYCERESKRYWKATLGRYGTSWTKYLNKNRVYYNANISRFYISDVNKSISRNRFELLKKIWSNREILIVEGEKSRLGIGNDLFDNALEISRILAPAQNAFDKYDDILKKVLKYDKNKLILIALGPTATVLAYDLAKKGYQAIDIGHVDIEYEWFLMRVTKKVPIKGKEVNEVREKSIEEFNDKTLKEYYSQIIDYVR